jgi:ABC-type transport system involved in cytochrome bd biosynthesis fused ATPase/permease subunit
MEIKVVIDEAAIQEQAGKLAAQMIHAALNEALNPKWSSEAAIVIRAIVVRQIKTAANKLALDPSFAQECERVYREAILQRIADRGRNRASKIKLPETLDLPPTEGAP